MTDKNEQPITPQDIAETFPEPAGGGYTDPYAGAREQPQARASERTTEDFVAEAITDALAEKLLDLGYFPTGNSLNVKFEMYMIILDKLQNGIEI